jgi:NADH-quinone oxidoreductase subunit E
VNPLLNHASPEVQAILSKYPPDDQRSAIMPLLFLAQRENGYVTKDQISAIAELVNVTTTEVASVVGFYTLYHDKPEGRHRIQVCTDLPCMLKGGQEFLDQLCANIGIKVGETTSDGLITIEEVTCLAGCHRAPMFQLQTPEGISYHENQTVKSTLALVDKLREDASKGGKA